MIIDGPTWTKNFEGCVLLARPDAKGKWEIGYGFNYLSDGTAVTAHTPHMTVAQAQAELATLAGRVLAAARAVRAPAAHAAAGAGRAAAHRELTAPKAPPCGPASTGPGLKIFPGTCPPSPPP